MSSILANVSVVLGADISAFRAGMAQARRELKGIVQAGEAMKDLGKSLATYVTAPLVALGAGAVAASGKVESLRNALNAISTQDLAKAGTTGLAGMAQAATLTTARMKELEVLARQPGLGFEQAVQGDVRLRAVGISAEQSAKSLKAFANAIATTGGGKSEFDRVTVQLAQLSAKGKVLAQDLRPIIEAAPAVSAALQKLYGTVDSEEISKQLGKAGQSSTDFIAVLTEELGKIPTVAGGLKNSLENLGDTVTLSLAKIGDGISKALNLPAVLAGISNFITRASEAFSGLSPASQKLIVVLAGVAAATGPVLVALGTIGAATPAVVAGFRLLTSGSLALSGALGTSLKAAMAALLTPTGAVVAVVATLAAVVYAAVTANERAYQSFREQSAATRQLTTDISPLLDRYDELKAKTTLSVDEQAEMKSIIEQVTAVLPEAGKGFDAYGNYIELATGKAREFIAGNQALEKRLANLSLPAEKKKLAELTEQYGYLAKIKDEISSKGTFNGVSIEDLGVKAVIEFRENLNAANTALEQQKKRVAELTGTVSGLGAAYEEVTGLPGGDIAGAKKLEDGLLASLRERLKLVKEQRESETEVAAIMADNKVIKSLEAQIAALEGVDKKTKKAQDALQKLAEELRGNGQLSNALGQDYDFLGERQKILESGLKSLVLAGVSPASAAFRKYAAELRQLNTDLGDNARLSNSAIDGLAKLKVIPDDKKKVNPLDGSEIKDFSTPDKLQLRTPAVDVTATVQSLTQFQQFVGQFKVGLQETVESMSISFAGAFSGIAQSIGQSLADGQSALAAFGDGLLKAFGQIIVQFGEKLILLGIGNVAAQNYAVGAAQLAAGGLLVGAGAYVSANAGGSYGGNSTMSPISGISQAPAVASTPQKIQVEVVGTLRGAGKDLVAIIEAQSYRRLRTT